MKMICFYTTYHVQCTIEHTSYGTALLHVNKKSWFWMYLMELNISHRSDKPDTSRFETIQISMIFPF